MARKKAVSKSKDTRRRYTDEFKEEAVQTMLVGIPGYHHASTEVYKTIWQR
jgi:transposase-like protein